MQETVWRHLRWCHPAEWEMLLYSKNPDVGRCTFADRYQYRLEVNWTAAPKPPNLERLLDDARSRVMAGNAESTVLLKTVAGWSGLVAREAKQHFSRFARYFPTGQLLVEVVFRWPGERDTDLEREVLRSMREEPVVDGRQRWQAFGMTMRVAEGLPLTECVVQPGLARLAFAQAGGHEVHFERLGMVDEWLQVSVADWLRRRAPRGARALQLTESMSDAHAVQRLTGLLRKRGLRHWRGLPYTAHAWRCPADGRIYCQTVTGKMTLPARLACIDGVEDEA